MDLEDAVAILKDEVRHKCSAYADIALAEVLPLVEEKFTSTNTGSPKLADLLSDALELCHSGEFDLGYQVINGVIGQLRASA